MNIPKKVKAILLTFVMLLSMSLNALAETVDWGADPLEETVGSITIHKYEGLTRFDHDGSEIVRPPDTRLANNDEIWNYLQTLTPLEGVTFRVTQVTLNDGEPEGSEVIGHYTKGASVTVTTDEYGLAKVANLPLGIYYVEELTDSAGSTGTTEHSVVDPFFVQIPMTAADGSTHIYDVHVYPKNQVFNFNKEVVAAEDGNSITWQISSTIPTNIETAKSFVITDELDTRLRLEQNTITVKAIAADETVVATLNKSTDGGLTGDYTIEFDSGKNEFKIVFTDDGFTKLATLIDADETTPAAKTIEITFNTTIKMDQTDPVDWEAIYNSAKLDYDNNDGSSFTAKTGDEGDPDPFVAPFGLKINKVDVDSAPIKDSSATFYIFADEDDAQDAIDGVSGALAKALKDPNNSDSPWSVDTVDGIANIYGLTEGTYYLAETTAPEGFHKLQSPVVVTITFDETNNSYSYEVSIDGTLITRGDSVIPGEDDDIVGGVIEFKVTNISGFTLPQTGGAGTLLFTLIGLLLIAAAIVIYTISKKRKEQQA